MKKTLPLASLLFGFSSLAQAAAVIEECVEIYDPAYDSYYFDCYQVETQVTISSTVYDIQGSYDLYTSKGLVMPNVPVSGRLIIEDWVDTYVGAEGQSIIIDLDYAFFTYSWDSYTFNDYSGSSQSYESISDYIQFGDWEYFLSSTTDATGNTTTTEYPATLWEIDFAGNPITLRTLDNDGDGLPGVRYFDYSFNDTITLDFQLQAVPVPPAVWLFGSGLIALLSLANPVRKRSKT